jgi:hypothetical protein
MLDTKTMRRQQQQLLLKKENKVENKEKQAV